jgi:hypothetical protein
LFGEKFGSFDVDVSLQKTNIDMGNPWNSTMKTDHLWNWLAEKSPTSALGELQQTSGASEIPNVLCIPKVSHLQLVMFPPNFDV